MFGKRDKVLATASTEEWVPWIWARHGNEGSRAFVEIEGARTTRQRIYGGQTLNVEFKVIEPQDALLAYKPKP